MNLLDYAAVAVPTVLCRPVPFGVTLVAPCGHDLKLLDIADRLHRTSGLHVGHSDALPGVMPFAKADDTISLAVCGAHLRGQPLHHQLEELGAVLDTVTRTAPEYRMYAFKSGGIHKPGLIHEPAKGASVYVEVYRLSAEGFGRFVSRIPAPLGIGKLRLEDGRQVSGFIAEAEVASMGTDITHLADWRNFRP
jgi:allophanate hydrolase